MIQIPSLLDGLFFGSVPDDPGDVIDVSANAAKANWPKGTKVVITAKGILASLLGGEQDLVRPLLNILLIQNRRRLGIMQPGDRIEGALYRGALVSVVCEPGEKRHKNRLRVALPFEQ